MYQSAAVGCGGGSDDVWSFKPNWWQSLVVERTACVLAMLGTSPGTIAP